MKQFPGFRFPEKNYYQFPKDLNGYYNQLNGNEFKVLSYIIRKTWGFNKIEDKISYSQFLKGVVNKEGITIFTGLGMSEDTLTHCLKSLKEKGFIEIDSFGSRGGRTSTYRLKYNHPEIQGGDHPEIAVETTPKFGETIVNNTISLISEGKALLSTKKEIKITLPRRDLEIVKLWVGEMKLKPENKIELGQIIRRNIRAAQGLVGYSDEDIIETILILKNTDYLKGHFTMETIGKYIDEVKAQKIKKGPEIIRFEEIKMPNGKTTMKAIYEKQNKN